MSASSEAHVRYDVFPVQNEIIRIVENLGAPVRRRVTQCNGLLGAYCLTVQIDIV